MSVKLPRSWRHWCRRLGLEPKHDKRRASSWFYLVGRGHHWRVNCHGMLQLGDDYAEFDRWALCVIDEIELPPSWAEMRRAVGRLLAERRSRRP